MSNGKCAQYAMGAGCDPMGLGRWCWVRYRGRNNIALRVVSLYCPCERRAGHSKGLSVYDQHLKCFNTDKDDMEPRQAFIEDFETELVMWLESGDQIVVGGDWNHNIFTEPPQRSIEAMLQSHGLHNMIFQLHNPDNFPSSSGHTTVNKRTVDGIWGTVNLVPSPCGQAIFQLNHLVVTITPCGLISHIGMHWAALHPESCVLTLTPCNCPTRSQSSDSRIDI